MSAFATVQLRRLARVRNGADYKTVEDPDGEYPVYGSGGEFSRASKYLYKGPAVLLGRKGTIDKPLLVDGEYWTVDTMFCAQPEPGVDPRFLFYACTTIPFNLLSTSTALPSMTQGDLNAVTLPGPSQEVQTLVANFLDRETAKIDALIAKQEQLIATLQEDRIATITHAVTRGLNPIVEMRDSEIEWIGVVPAHWTVDRLKWSVQSSKNGYWGTESEHGPGTRCIRVADFDRPRLSIHDNNVTSRGYTTSELQAAGLRRGDLLLEKSGGGEKSPVGFVVIYESDEPAVPSNFIARLRVASRQVPRFWLYVHCWLYSRRLTAPSIKQNTGIQNLDEHSYLDTRVAYPPDSEQAEIVEHLDERCGQIDMAILRVGELIATLREYRSALITDAVTGKIDVREMV